MNISTITSAWDAIILHFSTVFTQPTAAWQPVKSDYMLKDDRLDIILKKKLVLFENQTLEVTIQRQGE